MTICFASNNKNKHSEIQTLLDTSVKIQTLDDIGCTEELAETQDTIEGNAIQKAAYIFDKFNIPCFADDTGLEVEALNGEPGVFSARYAGAHKNSNDNMQLLLQNLKGKSNRNARFKTVITFVDQGGTHSFTGIINGIISEYPRGTKGFGYDPVFIPEGTDKSFGEMEMEEKNRFSHRAKATRQLISFLKERFQ